MLNGMKRMGKVALSAVLAGTLMATATPLAFAAPELDVIDISSSSGSSGSGSGGSSTTSGSGNESTTSPASVNPDVSNPTSSGNESTTAPATIVPDVDDDYDSGLYVTYGGDTSGTTAKNYDGSSSTGDSVRKRLGGTSRYDTMSAIVSAGFTSSEWAVVATGDSFPDALVANSLAGVRGCPVVLTGRSALSSQAKTQLSRLGVKNVYVVGGEGAVSQAVVSEIEGMGIGVSRISGLDRTGTSIAAFKEARAAGSVSDTVILATGDNFADPLSIGAWSYASKSPILLLHNGVLSDDAVSAITSDGRVKNIVIVGGVSAVPDSVKDVLGGSFGYVRLGGDDRYKTSSAIATWTASSGLKDTIVFVATGANFPDALAGAAFAGKVKGTFLLESGGGTARNWLTGRTSKVSSIYVLGGETAVSSAVMDGLVGL